MAKIKLAYVTHGLSSNGIESFLVNIVHHIDMNKYDVSFIIAIDEGVKSLHEDAVLSLGAKIIHVCDLDTIQKKAQYINSLEKIFRDGKFDIVHANMDLLNGIVLEKAKKAGIRMRICHAHNSSSQYGITGDKSAVMKTVQKMYQFTMKKLIIKNANCLLGCSEKANEYMFGKHAEKAKVIYNGILLDRFLNPEVKGKTELGMPEKNINIITVGRLSAQKNPPFILDIVEALSKIRQDFVLNWVGSGEMEDYINSEIASRNLSEYINMMGVRSDIPSVLCECEYFILPSLFEGLGISLIEAQAEGLECFASSVVPSLADLGGVHFLDLESGAQKWAEYINDRICSHEKLTADREKVMQFDISHTVSQLDAVYSER